MNTETFTLLEELKPQIQKTINATNTRAGDDVDILIDRFVNGTLLEIIALGQVVLADGKIRFDELIRLVTFTSRSVATGLDIYTKTNNTEKLKVVREIIQLVVSKLFAGPSGLKDFVLNDKNLDGVINIVYKLLVK